MSRLAAALILAVAIAGPALGAPTESDQGVAQAAADIAHRIFQDVDWRTRLIAKSADIDAQAAQSGLAGAWATLAKQAMLEETDQGRADIDQAMATYFARYFTPDELQAGDVLMRSEAGIYIAQIEADPTAKVTPGDNVRRALTATMSTPAGAAFVKKLDALGRDPAQMNDVIKPAFVLGFIERFAGLISQSDEGRAAAAEPETDLQRHMLEAVSIMLRDVDYEAVFGAQINAGDFAALPSRPAWQAMVLEATRDTFANDRGDIDRIIAMSLAKSFTLEEVDAALVVLRTPEGAAISREVANAAAGHPSPHPPHDALLASEHIARTAAGRRFMQKFGQFGTLAQGASSEIVAFEVPHVMHLFAERARAAEANRPISPAT